MDCSPPGSYVHGIFQARILVWVAIPFSRESSQPRDQILVSCIAGRDQTLVSYIAGRFFTVGATREGHKAPYSNPNYFCIVLLKTSGIQLCKTSEILLVFFTCCLAPERIHGVYTLGLKFQVMKRLRKFEKVKSNKIINKFHSLFFLALKKSFFLGISFPFNVYIN